MKKILFIATGGTIACESTQTGLAPKNTAEQLLELMMYHSSSYVITTKQLFNLDSTNMSPREWTEIATEIQREYNNFDGFVISHGTDTLAYAAAALSCLIQNSNKPVVLTGSQLPMSAKGSDAKKNLEDAIFTACSDLCGIAVVFNGRIMDGRCVKKLHTRDFDAFRSIGRDDIGSVYGGTVTLYEKQNHDVAPIFFNRMDSAVSVVKLIPGLDPSILDHAAQSGRAVVIEGFGTGGIPDYGNREFENKIAELTMSGVIMIMTTQVLEGGCDMSLYEVGREVQSRYRIIEAKRMTTELAVMKAMWALAFAYSAEDFKALYEREI